MWRRRSTEVKFKKNHEVLSFAIYSRYSGFTFEGERGLLVWVFFKIIIIYLFFTCFSLSGFILFQRSSVIDQM